MPEFLRFIASRCPVVFLVLRESPSSTCRDVTVLLFETRNSMAGPASASRKGRARELRIDKSTSYWGSETKAFSSLLLYAVLLLARCLAVTDKV